MAQFPSFANIFKRAVQKSIITAKSCFTSISQYIFQHSIRYFAGIIAVAVAILALMLPSAYVIEEPGPTQDVLSDINGLKIIDIENSDTKKSDIGDSKKSDSQKSDIKKSDIKDSKKTGKLLLVTVGTSGVPGYETTTFNAIKAWLNPERTLDPREAIVPIGQTEDQYEKESNEEMTSSQDSAIKAAKIEAKKLGLSTTNKKISLHIEDIGGPSAGMIYSLGILNKINKYDITGGKTIAGTGTIDEKGNVGAIGGIQLKMLGAKRDGATWFLAPESNCDEVEGHIPSGLRVVKVATLDDAWKALEAIRSGKNVKNLPSCSAKLGNK